MQTFNQVAERDTSATKVDEFIGTCLMSVTYMHSAHFMTRSYSQHKAFQEFYEEMQTLIDKFTETYIGISGRYKPVLKTENSLDTVEYLRRIAVSADEIYASIDTCLQSIIDDIKSLCYQTIYKLTQLS